MTLADYQRDVVSMLFAKDFEKYVGRLATDPRGQSRYRVYRRMVRSRLRDAIEGCFPQMNRALALVAGPASEGDALDRIVEAWLDVSPPRSPYLRDVAGELTTFLEAAPPADAPPWLAALARHEWTLLDVEYAHEEEGAALVKEVGALDFEKAAVLTPAHRIVRSRWSVHRALEAPASLTTKIEPGDFALCYYRDPATHAVRILELTPIAAAILERIAPGDRTVVEAVKDASSALAFPIDAPFVEAFSELVSDLVERGVWLGSRET